MSADLRELVEEVLGDVPSAEQLPQVLRALRAGAWVCWRRADVGVVHIEPGTEAAAGLAALRPGRSPVEQLAAIGAALDGDDSAQPTRLGIRLPCPRSAESAARWEERRTAADE